MPGIENKIEFANGFKLQPSDATSISNMQELPTDIGFINHTGNPNGSVAANPGSTAYDPVNGTLYQKATGTGNTGWVLVSGASGTTTNLIPNSGTSPVVPDGSGNITLIGQTAGSVQVMQTVGGLNQMTIEDRTIISSLVVDPSATVGLRGTFQTITAALTAAVSGQTIYVRPGSYVENLTLKAGVDICAMTGDAYSTTVSITGSITATYAGRASITGCRLVSGTSDGVTISGASATVLTIKDCVLSQAAGAGTHYSMVMSNGAAELYVFDCFGTTDANGSWLNCTNGQVLIQNVNFANNGGTSLNNLVSGGSVKIESSRIGTNNSVGAGFAVSGGELIARHCNFSGQLISSATGSLLIYESIVHTPNAIALTVGGSGATECSHSVLTSNTATAISISQSLQISNCRILSNNTNAIDGVGTINYGGLVFIGSSSLITTTTQVPYVSSNDAMKITSPGAYPYTTVPQDAVILVDTSSARTIIPLASPTTGQRHVIKDSVGSAAANNITITPSGKNIDGSASSTINLNYGSVTIVYNGTEWSII